MITLAIIVLTIVITKHKLTLVVLLSIVAPFSINNLAISNLPDTAVQCSGVFPSYEIDMYNRNNNNSDNSDNNQNNDSK